MELNCFLAGDGTHLRELVHPKNGDGVQGFSLAHAYLEVGEASFPHRLKKSSETYYFLQGNGTINIEGEEFPVEVNNHIVVPANAQQFVKNTGSSRLSFLCIVSPPWAEEEEEVDVR